MKTPKEHKPAGDLSKAINPENPRKLSAAREKRLRRSIKEFGDLGCVVLNVRTRHLVGGNQRSRIFADDKRAKVHVQHRYAQPTKTGTVAEGYIILGGERHKYREVDWTEQRERLAMIAANEQGGEFDAPSLSELMHELMIGKADLDLTGFGQEDIARILAPFEVPGMNRALDEEELGKTNICCPSCGFKWAK